MSGDLSSPPSSAATDVTAPPTNEISPEQRLLVLEGHLNAKLAAMCTKINRIHDSVDKTDRPLGPEDSAIIDAALRQYQIVSSDFELTDRLRISMGAEDPARTRDAYGREVLNRNLNMVLAEETGRDAVLDDIANDRLLLKEMCEERRAIREKELHDLEDRMTAKLVDLESKIDHINSSVSEVDVPLSHCPPESLSVTAREASYLRQVLSLPSRPAQGMETVNKGPASCSVGSTVVEATASIDGSGSWTRLSEAAKDLEELLKMKSVRQTLLEMQGNLQKE